jgi:hypothetical protein
MAIRIPSELSKQWLCQDFLQADIPGGQLRHLRVKFDQENFTTIAESFDIGEQGGPIVGQINYTKIGMSITIDSWSFNWRDEWPLRIGVNHLVNCLYNTRRGFVHRVIPRQAYAFWVSEDFVPSLIKGDPYLYLT